MQAQLSISKLNCRLFSPLSHNFDLKTLKKDTLWFSILSIYLPSLNLSLGPSPQSPKKSVVSDLLFFISLLQIDQWARTTKLRISFSNEIAIRQYFFYLLIYSIANDQDRLRLAWLMIMIICHHSRPIWPLSATSDWNWLFMFCSFCKWRPLGGDGLHYVTQEPTYQSLFPLSKKATHVHDSQSGFMWLPAIKSVPPLLLFLPYHPLIKWDHSFAALFAFVLALAVCTLLFPHSQWRLQLLSIRESGNWLPGKNSVVFFVAAKLNSKPASISVLLLLFCWNEGHWNCLSETETVQVRNKKKCIF